MKVGKEYINNYIIKYTHMKLSLKLISMPNSITSKVNNSSNQ